MTGALQKWVKTLQKGFAQNSVQSPQRHCTNYFWGFAQNRWALQNKLRFAKNEHQSTSLKKKLKKNHECSNVISFGTIPSFQSTYSVSEMLKAIEMLRWVSTTGAFKLCLGMGTLKRALHKKKNSVQSLFEIRFLCKAFLQCFYRS